MRIALELRIKHGVLYESCLIHGGVRKFAGKLGVSYQTLLRWLNMRSSPVIGRYSKTWTKKHEKRLEKLTGVKAEVMFPDSLREYIKVGSESRAFVCVKEIETVALLDLDRMVQQRLTTSDPIQDAMRTELSSKLGEVLGTLPQREQEVINMRYKQGMTLEDAACKLKVTRERIRQIEARAIRTLQEPGRSEKLLPFIETFDK